VAGQAIVEGRGLTKRFGGITALDSVDFSVAAGQITALLGENGAGKSTLVACLSGAQRPDVGEVLIQGEPMRFRSPDDARRSGIAVIHQEPQMLEAQTVAANIFLPRLASRSGFAANAVALNARAIEHLATLEIRDLEPSRPMRAVSGAQRQLVEIARALIHEPRVLFLDEPNASLGEVESERLFAVMRRLRDRGVAVVLVSHRLREVYQVADHVIIMRDGHKVADEAIERLPVERAIRFITGDRVHGPTAQTVAGAGAPRRTGEHRLLEVRHLTGPGFEDVSFGIAAGEIVGMSGLVGSGRTEIAHAIIGAAKKLSGSIALNGQPVDFSDPSRSLRQGIAYVPEGRRDAVFYGQSVDFNIRAGLWGEVPPGKSRPSRATATSAVRALMSKLAVKARGSDVRASTLSGGNQQKLLFARALSGHPRLLILDEPTHGVDIGTKREIHDLIRNLAAEGIAIWFISSEVEEVVELATRILVVHQGRIAGELMAGTSIEAVLSRNFGEAGLPDEQ
jgi:ABC-type sugar transport system ATPase subunit